MATDGPASPAEVLAWGAALTGTLETAHSSGIHAAPEIIGGSPASPSSDVYSPASVLFLALTGSAPFDRPGEESLAPLIARIADPPDLREHGVLAPLAAVITQALAKDAGARPASAAAFGQALQDAAAALSLPIPDVPISNVAPDGNLFEIPLSERATPRMGTVQGRPPARGAARADGGGRRAGTPSAGAPVGGRRRDTPRVGRGGRRRCRHLGGRRRRRQPRPPARRRGRAHRRRHRRDPGLLGLRRPLVGGQQRAAGEPDRQGREVHLVRGRPAGAGLLGRRRAVLAGSRWVGGRRGHRVLGAHPRAEREAGPELGGAAAGRRGAVAGVPQGGSPADRRGAGRAPGRDRRQGQGGLAADGASAPPPVEDPGSLASGQDPATVPGTGGGTAGGGGTTGGGSPANPGGPGAGPVDTGSVGGSVPVPNGGTTGTGGGTTTGGTGGGTGGGTAGGSPAPAPTANRAPTISASNQTSNEQAGVSVTFSASDPDGDSLTWSASGLPPGLSISGGRVSGTIPYSALFVTSTKNAIQSRGYTVTLTATDPSGAKATKSITWTVRDTHIAMPNYFHKWGCGTSSNCDGPGYPNVADLSAQDFNCAVDPAWVDHIVGQSVPAGQVIAWGQRVVYTYANTSC